LKDVTSRAEAEPAGGPAARPGRAPASNDPPGPRGGSLDTELAGEQVVLRGERALFWPRLRALLVADLHLGKAATFRANGVPLPRGSTAADLDRLSRAIAATGAESLYVLGDFLHAARGRVDALDDAFTGWRRAHRSLAITVVRGNHDAHAGDPPVEWRVEAVAEPLAVAPFVLVHDPAREALGYALGGHVHPGVRIAAGGDSVRLPCFVLGRHRAILPAFAGFSGIGTLDPLPGDRAVAIAGSRLFAVPEGGARFA
jgi:DNA ligase-associated metallophosphoesterase